MRFLSSLSSQEIGLLDIVSNQTTAVAVTVSAEGAFLKRKEINLCKPSTISLLSQFTFPAFKSNDCAEGFA